MYWGMLSFKDFVLDGLNRIKSVINMCLCFMFCTIKNVIHGFLNVILFVLYKVFTIAYNVSKLFIFPILYLGFTVLYKYFSNNTVDAVSIKYILILFFISIILYLIKSLIEKFLDV